MKQPVRLRKASLADLSLLRDWDRKAHVAAASGADEPYDWKSELPRDVDWREFLIAEIDGDPIGFIQIIDPAIEETHYWGAIEPNLRAIDIWIGHDGNLGRGFGTQMMQLALERCFAVPAVDAVLLDPLASNVRAHRFYERLGFRAVERRTFGSDDCIVYRLGREDWEAEKQRQARGARSPLQQPGSSERAKPAQNSDAKGVPDGNEKR
jgi:aminoglycoside 6'-N-acetyltransferase